ncbi:MAG TPA: hypothetical protein PLS71_12285 [Leptospiraceae bacterium]|nr:hypothetical protein [Leptospiraceae bacterium]HNB99014.1 hypothetical protein [Leptospiraceae bacterium]HNE07483.1 hypothetical protein [Leptospiraceae bacterium]HNH01499.1 hypothetical protein [Leptospiraceae bacterium]HNI90768.1 hypothetical protein [Leptospiraceae bacterium]
MLFKTYIVISIFTTGLLFAQNQIKNSDKGEGIGAVQQKSDKPKPVANSASAKAMQDKIASLEKEIIVKISDIEKLQAEAVEFNPEMKKEIRIVYEQPKDHPIPGPQKYLVYRYVEYEMDGGSKIKEIRVISKHRSLMEDMHSIVKVVSFKPNDMSSIKVTVDKLETKAKGIQEVVNYNDFAPEVKLQALKTIDTTLFNSIFRLDTFIQRNQLSKNDKNRNQLEGL